ncbi:MAG: hypothetical protein ACX932_02435, partial [Gammaproteobacteria bacterium]
ANISHYSREIGYQLQRIFELYAKIDLAKFNDNRAEIRPEMRFSMTAADAIELDIFNAATTIGAAAANAVQPGTGTVVSAGGMVAVDTFITVGKTIYEIAQNNQYCKKRSLRLAEGVAILCRALLGLKDTSATTDSCKGALENTLKAMKDCEEFVAMFDKQHRVIRFLSSGAHKKRFIELQEALKECLNELQTAFGSQIILNLEAAKVEITLDLHEESEKLQEALEMQRTEVLEELEGIVGLLETLKKSEEKQTMLLEHVEEDIDTGKVLLNDAFNMLTEYQKEIRQIQASLLDINLRNKPGATIDIETAEGARVLAIAIGSGSAKATIGRLTGGEAIAAGINILKNAKDDDTDNHNYRVALDFLERELSSKDPIIKEKLSNIKKSRARLEQVNKEYYAAKRGSDEKLNLDEERKELKAEIDEESDKLEIRIDKLNLRVVPTDEEREAASGVSSFRM